jgi:endonuclease G
MGTSQQESTMAKPKSKSKSGPARQAATAASARAEALERMHRLIRAQGEALLMRPNVTSVAIGYKRDGDRLTDELALQFSVERKMAPETLAAESIPVLPKTIEFEGVQIPTDVVERNYQNNYTRVALAPKDGRKSRQDPLRAGISVGHVNSSGGTLGLIVRDGLSGEPLILSNWHVLCGTQGQPGDLVVQPGRYDDDRVDANRVGVLRRSHLGLAGDCAVASIEQRRFALEVLGLGTQVKALGKPELGDLVVKSGRTTGVTYGRVSRIDGVFKLSYDGKPAQAVGGFEIEPSPQHPSEKNEISKGGDSGSAWLAADPRTGKATDVMLGLHFGGDAEGSDGEFALACYAHSVFQKLEIEPLAGAASANQAQAQAATRSTADALRRGFDAHFLDFEVPRPGFDSKLSRQLKGLNGGKFIDYCHFSVWLSGKRKLPACVAWNVDGNSKKSLSRKGIEFVKDDRDGLDAYQIGDELYDGNDFDRGHVARRDDLVWGVMAQARQANVDSFFFTNMTPQHKRFNQSQLKGQWGLLENAILDDVELRHLRVSLMGGPILAADDPVYREVQIPREFWKVVFYTDDSDGENKARAFVLTQRDLVGAMAPEALELEAFRWYQVSLASIEKRTGVRFARELHALDTKFPEALGPQARLVTGNAFFVD